MRISSSKKLICCFDILVIIYFQPVFIKMRKTDKDMEFKGSIFTELETQEQANSLLENKELKIDDEELMLVMKRFIYLFFFYFLMIFYIYIFI